MTHRTFRLFPHNRLPLFFLLICSFSIVACNELIETDPEHITDTSDVVITCDASQGNRGLLDYEGDVFVHVGLITSKSEHKDDWRYLKFNWGSRESPAKATPVEKNRWSFAIKNIRQYFNVDKDEKIVQLAILFRSGACIDVYCKTLRNADDSNMYIPIHDESVTE